MTKKKKVILIIVIIAAILLIAAAVLVALLATGNLFGTPVVEDYDTALVLDGQPELTNASEDYAAAVTIDGKTTYYTTATEAWQHVVSDKETRFTLLKDWVADANGNFGDGGGYFNGMIYINRRSTDLILDLNGFTIDKGLYNPEKGIDKPKNCGGIFYFCSDATLWLINGTLRGGNAQGDGGAIYFGGEKNKGKLRLINMTLTSNKATEEGSAIWCNTDNIQELSLTNVTITGNYVGQAYGGAVRTTSRVGGETVYMHEKVIIKDNLGVSEYGNNLSLWGAIRDAETLTAGSQIYVYMPKPEDMGLDPRADVSDKLCYNSPASSHDTLCSYFVAENGYLESGHTFIFVPVLYYYHNK